MAASISTDEIGSGFADPVGLAQVNFNALMWAMARPGIPHRLEGPVQGPEGLSAAASAVLLTLADMQSAVWLPTKLRDSAAGAYVRFHCGARLVTDPHEAAFGIVAAGQHEITIAHFSPGEDAYPDRSTTLIVEVPALTGGPSVRLTGPGIKESVIIAPEGLDAAFWKMWRLNHVSSPLGVDVLLVAGDCVIGLPRSTAAERLHTDSSTQIEAAVVPPGLNTALSGHQRSAMNPIKPNVRTGRPQREKGSPSTAVAYNFAYLDEQSKRMIRRCLLKAIAVPGYQVPFGGREMPLAYGWGTGGIQVTASIIGRDDILKVIDQGSDDTTNAVSIRRFFQRVAGIATTEATREATIIQTRHRIPEEPLTENQVLVYQVPHPEPLRKLEPLETETRKMHANEEYGLMQVRLYEDIARHGHIATTYDYPVLTNDRYVMAPTPIPKFDNPKMDMMPALQLFGAGREKRIYAIPPYTRVKSLDFEDHPFTVQTWDEPCALCGATEVYLDEVVIDDANRRMFVCSDSHYCEDRCGRGERGKLFDEAQGMKLLEVEGS